MEAAGLSRQALFASQQAPDPFLHGLLTFFRHLMVKQTWSKAAHDIDTELAGH